MYVEEKPVKRRVELQIGNSDEPLFQIYELCRQANTPGHRFLSNTLQHNLHVRTNPLNKALVDIRERQGATKFMVYRSTLNPSLSVHKVYSSEKFIPDHKRQAFTQLRVMSHSLRVETGRWSRIPPEMRLCTCDQHAVQTEEHVLLACPLSRTLRLRYGSLDFYKYGNFDGGQG